MGTFFYGYTHHIWKFLAQGLNPGCSCDLHHSCDPSHSHGNARSFNPLPEIKPTAETWAVAVGFLTHYATAGTPMRTSCCAFAPIPLAPGRQTGTEWVLKKYLLEILEMEDASVVELPGLRDGVRRGQEGWDWVTAEKQKSLQSGSWLW